MSVVMAWVWRTIAWLAVIWAFVFGTLYCLVIFFQPEAWGIPIIGLVGIAFASIGIIGIYRGPSWTWTSGGLLFVLIFSPGLAGIPFAPAALLMLLAALMESLSWSSLQRRRAALGGGHA